MPITATRPGIVVTGAAGFIGRHVVARLRDAGHRVTGIDRRPWTPVEGERPIVTDLLDDDLGPVWGLADAVVHLAGCPGVRDSRPGAGRWRWRDNVLSGHAVLTAVPKPTTLVVASSSSVYGGAGPVDAPRASQEDDVRRPRGGYARSKAVLEDLCTARAAAGGHVAVLRPFTVAGEGQRSDMALARWLAAARTGGTVTILGSLSRRRDVTDVAMVARAVERALQVGLSGVCNLGTGRACTLAQMLDAVTAVIGRRPEVRTVAAPSEEVAATLADTTRCATQLGFVPTTDLHDVVARQAAATSVPIRA